MWHPRITIVIMATRHSLHFVLFLTYM